MFIVDWLFFITIIPAIASSYYWKDEIGPGTYRGCGSMWRLRWLWRSLFRSLAAQSPCSWDGPFSRPLSFSVLDALADVLYPSNE